MYNFFGANYFVCLFNTRGICVLLLDCVIYQNRYSTTKAILIALFFTTSRAFDIPVYYPILLGYFVLLFVLTMRKQIQHMIKYKYVPFTIGKKSYKPSATGPTVATSLGSASIHSMAPPAATGGLLNTISSFPTMTTTSLSYTPATGASTGYQLPKPGMQQQQSNVPTPVYQGFQTTVTPMTTSVPVNAASATTAVKTGKKD